MSSSLKTHTFTVEEFHRMGQVGILTELDRVELMDGEIVEMTPIGPEHAACVRRLDALLNRQVGAAALVSIQNPVQLSDRTELHPDVALLRPRSDAYGQAHPGPEDVLLVIEVASTSAETDRRVKLPRYGKVGIPEVWLVDLAQAHVEVYRQPIPTGYQTARAYRRDSVVSPERISSVVVNIEEIIP